MASTALVLLVKVVVVVQVFAQALKLPHIPVASENNLLAWIVVRFVGMNTVATDIRDNNCLGIDWLVMNCLGTGLVDINCWVYNKDRHKSWHIESLDLQAIWMSVQLRLVASVVAEGVVVLPVYLLVHLLLYQELNRQQLAKFLILL